MRKKLAAATALSLCGFALAAVSGIEGQALAAPAAKPAGQVVVKDPASACAALAGYSITAAQIGLPTTGAVVSTATLTAADPTSGRPQFCLVQGKIKPVDPTALPITFEVNLPTTWNRKTLQVGGGGFDGILVTGVGDSPGSGVPNGLNGSGDPLDTGYVTFGSDGGSTADGTFGINAEDLANYSGDAVKKTRDTAINLVNRYYHQSPAEQYFIGGSKGGQEALWAAERYPDDYNGVISYYPASTNQGMVMTWYHMEQLAYQRPGAYLDPAKQQLVQTAAVKACDGLDGVVDGVISDVAGCAKVFNVSTLRCPGGADTGDTCLSDIQIDTLEQAAKPYVFDFPFANELNTIGGFPDVLTGAPLTGTWLDTTGQDQTIYKFLDDPVIQYFDEQDPNGSVTNFNYNDYENRVKAISQGFDTTNPAALDKFFARGGKLILVQGDDDMLVSPEQTTAFYLGLVNQYGTQVDNDTRYYVQPGYGHAGGSYSLSWNSLAALNTWVTQGTAPARPVGKDLNTGRTMPLCQYPAWPKYLGTGNFNSASSYQCVTGNGPLETATTITPSAAQQVYGAPAGQEAMLTVTVTGGNPAGTVTFADTSAGGATTLGTVTIHGGRATFRLPGTLAVGTHAISATYTPSATSETTSSTAAITLTVGK